MPMSSDVMTPDVVGLRSPRGGMLWFIALVVSSQGIGPLLILLDETFGPWWRNQVPGDMPEAPTSFSLYPLASYAIALVTAAVAIWTLRQFLFGTVRRQLKRGIIGMWLVQPGYGLVVSLLHWYALWQSHTQIYDLNMRLEALIEPTLLSSVFTFYLLRSARMQARFPVTSVDVAAVF